MSRSRPRGDAERHQLTQTPLAFTLRTRRSNLPLQRRANGAIGGLHCLTLCAHTVRNRPTRTPEQSTTPLPFPQTIAHLSRALDERKYEDPTPVQLAVLEEKADGRDLVVSAQTGSGKTVAYGLAIAKTLLNEGEVFPVEAHPVALIVAPTRELAMQVERELKWLYFYTGGWHGPQARTPSAE